VEVTAIDRTEAAIFEKCETFSLGSTAETVLCDHLMRLDRVNRQVTLTIATDYDDFNFLHLPASMKKFWRRVIGAAASTAASEGQWDGVNFAGHVQRCVLWLCDAIDQMYIREVGSDGAFRLVYQGLWSGWRTTTLINNVENYAYSSITIRSLEDALQHTVDFQERKVNGDDGDFATSKIVEGLLYLRHLALSRLDVQSSKQLIGYGHAEYLRIWYSDNIILGSVLRSIYSFISGDLQDPVIDTGPAYVCGTSAAINLLIRRGFSAEHAEVLREHTLMFYACHRDTAIDGTRRVRRVHEYEKLFIPQQHGGWGAVRYNNPSDRRFCTSRSLPSSRVHWDLDELPHHGARCMETAIHKHLARFNARVGHPDRLRRDILDVTNAGIDTSLNFASSNIPRALVNDHIEWMNQTSTCQGPPDLVLSPESIAQMTDAITGFFNLSDLARRQYAFPRIKKSIGRVVQRILSLGSISPALLGDIVDITTGAPLSLENMMERAEITWTPTTISEALMPDHVFEMFAREHLPYPTIPGHVVPDDFLPLVEVGLVHAIRCNASQSSDYNVQLTHYRLVCAAFANWFAPFWVANYSHQFKF
jgi:hypothetical protein